VALKVFIVALFSISGISAFLFLIFGINKNGKDWQSINLMQAAEIIGRHFPE